MRYVPLRWRWLGRRRLTGYERAVATYREGLRWAESEGIQAETDGELRRSIEWNGLLRAAMSCENEINGKTPVNYGVFI